MGCQDRTAAAARQFTAGLWIVVYAGRRKGGVSAGQVSCPRAVGPPSARRPARPRISADRGLVSPTRSAAKPWLFRAATSARSILAPCRGRRGPSERLASLRPAIEGLGFSLEPSRILYRWKAPSSASISGPDNRRRCTSASGARCSRRFMSPARRHNALRLQFAPRQDPHGQARARGPRLLQFEIEPAAVVDHSKQLTFGLDARGTHRDEIAACALSLPFGCVIRA